MKSVRLAAPGGLDRLRVVEDDDPGAPGPGEVRVRLHASSLNFHDYAVAAGQHPDRGWAHPDVGRGRASSRRSATA